MYKGAHGVKLYIARQPIVDNNNAPYAYEFLHRSSEENCYRDDIEGSQATSSLLSSLSFEFNLKRLTGGCFAFINFTEKLLLSKTVESIDPREVIIEILETVKPSEALLERLRELRKKNYCFALDDYLGEENPLIEVADIIKVDFIDTDREQQRAIAGRYPDKILLAEKVETSEDYEFAKENGYKLYQGYYFSRPVVIAKTAGEIATPTYLRLWREINKPDCNFRALERIIRTDVNLTYKVLNRLNSIEYYRGNKVTSLYHALVSLGFAELKRWILLLFMRNCYGSRDTVVAKQALTRAVFAEKLAALLGWTDMQEDAYTAGLFSLIDTIMEGNMESLLDELAIGQRVRDCLLEKPGKLFDLLSVVKNYDRTDWDAVDAFTKQYQIDPEKLSPLQLEAIEYAEQAFSV